MRRYMKRLKDAVDVAALRAAEAAVERGESELLPIEMVERILAGENPLRVWRRYRGTTAHQLAKAAGLTPSCLSEIERGRKPASFDAMARLARALKVAMEDLAPSERKASA
jgi:DNA-binding XRE family transcriptional regulator